MVCLRFANIIIILRILNVKNKQNRRNVKMIPLEKQRTVQKEILETDRNAHLNTKSATSSPLKEKAESQEIPLPKHPASGTLKGRPELTYLGILAKLLQKSGSSIKKIMKISKPPPYSTRTVTSKHSPEPSIASGPIQSAAKYSLESHMANPNARASPPDHGLNGSMLEGKTDGSKITLGILKGALNSTTKWSHQKLYNEDLNFQNHPTGSPPPAGQKIPHKWNYADMLQTLYNTQPPYLFVVNHFYRSMHPKTHAQTTNNVIEESPETAQETSLTMLRKSQHSTKRQSPLQPAKNVNPELKPTVILPAIKATDFIILGQAGLLIRKMPRNAKVRKQPKKVFKEGDQRQGIVNYKNHDLEINKAKQELANYLSILGSTKFKV